jgi:hypothetical protein
MLMDYTGIYTKVTNNWSDFMETTPKSARRRGLSKGLRLISVALLFSASILLVTLIVSFVFGFGRTESSYVNENLTQAVFLDDGQTYFGKIKSVNDKYLRLNDVYYLEGEQKQPTSPATTENVEPVKLGCQSYGAVDEMLINRDHVLYWENLRTDSKVAEAIAAYKQKNTNRIVCDTPAAATNSTTSTDKKN